MKRWQRKTNKMKLPYKVVAIDLETTGLDKDVASIVELGAVVVNEDLTIAREFRSYIKPLDSFRTEKAMEVNGITEEMLASAPTLEEVLMKFDRFSAGVRNLGAWGTYFDVQFLKAQYKKIDRQYPYDWRDFDLKTVAMWELGKREMATMKGVEACLKKLGLEFIGDAHSALDDIKNSVRILQHFCQPVGVETLKPGVRILKK